MRHLVLGMVVASCALGVAGCGSSSGANSSPLPSASSSGASTTGTGSTDAGPGCGVHQIGGVQVRSFCGDGTVSVTGGGDTLTIKNAACELSTNYMSVNGGTVVLGADTAARDLKATTQYIGLNVGRTPGDTQDKVAATDGTYTGGVLAVNDQGTSIVINNLTLTTTLTDNRHKGTFHAKPLVGNGTVTGSFDCS